MNIILPLQKRLFGDSIAYLKLHDNKYIHVWTIQTSGFLMHLLTELEIIVFSYLRTSNSPVEMFYLFRCQVILIFHNLHQPAV